MIYDGLLMGGSLVLSAKYTSRSTFQVGTVLINELGIISGARGLLEYSSLLIRNTNDAIIGGNWDNPNINYLSYIFVDNFNDFIYGGSALNVVASLGYSGNYTLRSSPNLQTLIKTSNFYRFTISTDKMLTWGNEFTLGCRDIKIANDSAILAGTEAGFMLSIDMGLTWTNQGCLYDAAKYRFAIYNSSTYAVHGLAGDDSEFEGHAYSLVCFTQAGSHTYTLEGLPSFIVYMDADTLFVVTKSDPGYSGSWLYKIDLLTNTMSLVSVGITNITSISICEGNIFIVDSVSYMKIFNRAGNLINSFNTHLDAVSDIQHNFL